VQRRLRGISAITFDFGNTLVPVDREGLRRVVRITAEQVASQLGPFPLDTFLETWADERERQFREDVPQFREVDLAERFVRVLARLRGVRPPPADESWDQAEAARHSTPAEIDWAVESYSRAFVDALPARPWVGELLQQLAADRTLAILSNWPLAATIDRYAEAAGWDGHLAAIVVSQRVGTIKPHPAIFAAALHALGSPDPRTVLHVGDDWAADVVGAAEAGWRSAWLDAGPLDSPLPSSRPAAGVRPDVTIRDLRALPDVLSAAPAPR
jgi:HAD superfamily hydrolase (TIGR01509 family)